LDYDAALVKERKQAEISKIHPWHAERANA
jgi:hypothetical protein